MSPSARWYGAVSGHRDGPVTDAPGHTGDSGRHRAARTGTRRVVLLVLLTACLALAGGVSLVLRLNNGRDQLGRAVSSVPQAAAPVQAAAAWAGTTLPFSSTLLADESTRAALIGAGLPAAEVVALRGSAGCTAASFVVVTSALRAAARTDAALGRCLLLAAPVAVFGSGGAAVQIAEVASQGAPTPAARRASEARDRTLAGAALAANPRVRTSAAVRAALTAGHLDLRAATVIAELAAHTAVQVTVVTDVAAEHAAGLPARSVALVLADATTFPAVLAGLSLPFRPSATVRTGPDSLRLVWPFRTAPIPILT